MIKKFVTEKNTLILIEILSVFAILFFGIVILANNKLDFSFYHNGDVHRGFHRGLDVWAGVNSYKAFNPDNMYTQEKVPGFFPLYFYVMAFFAWISNFSFIQFLDIFRIFIFAFYAGIGLLIYFYLRKTNILLALFGMCLFMFNRWTLFDVISLKQESYVLLLLLTSLLVLPKNKYLAFFILGLATGIKHLTILIFPLYLFYLLKDFDYKKTIISGLLFLTPIIIPSIWYIRDDPIRFLNSILFNVTREPESELGGDIVVGLDRVFNFYSEANPGLFLLLLPRIPLVIMLILVNILMFKQKISGWSYAALSYLIFMSFNPTLFDQYIVWFFAFLPFTFKEFFKKSI